MQKVNFGKKVLQNLLDHLFSVDLLASVDLNKFYNFANFVDSKKSSQIMRKKYIFDS